MFLYPATHIITDCAQLPQQTKKTSQQNLFAHHQRSVKVSDDVTLARQNRSTPVW